MTETGKLPTLASLAISPDLQALLEFDDRIRGSGETHEQPDVTPTELPQPDQYPSWGEQEVPTVSLPPPRRRKKKSTVTDGPMSPQTISELQRVSSPANTYLGVGGFEGLGEIVFARPVDALEEEMEVESNDSANPYLNSPPRYFYPISDDEEGRHDQPSPYYALKRSRSMRRPIRTRSSSDKSSPVERNGPGRLASSRYFSSVGRGVGSKERASGPRATASATRPMLLHSHKASLCSSHSHRTDTSYDPSSSPELQISISSTIYSASSVHSLPIPSSPSPTSIHGSFIDLGSPPMSPSSDVGSQDYRTAKSTSRTNSPRSSTPHSRSSSPMSKPPIPTTPKPVFNRPRSSRKSVDGKPRVEDPLTTTLSPAERSELVKKTRKLTQLFGQTPGPELASPSPVISNPLHPSDKGVWPPPEETVYLNINGRRHSTPLSPTTVSTMWGSTEDDSILDHDQRSFRSNKHSRVWLSRKGRSPSSMVSHPSSPMSFIDLSDDESAAERPGGVADPRRRATSPGESLMDDTASLVTLTSTEAYEEDRRRKREKLVKLHRFLGSRVPPDLVLGLDLSLSPPLPPLASPELEHEDTRKIFRMRKRRSSSCFEYTRPLTSQEDRMKSELDIQEKALNVRRAAKMEKVFGVAPPQTLFHTRKLDSPVPQSPGPVPILSTDLNVSPPLTPLDPLSFFTMQGFGYKGKKNKRPGTGESTQGLISRSEAGSSIEVYNSYRESLNSLIDIVDKDDKTSLELIHDILHANDDDGDDNDKPTQKVGGDGYDSGEPDIPSNPTPAVTPHGERRNSLPACPSIGSLRSEYSVASINSTCSITSPPPEISTFEQKRRRAAKLTNFFGVSHHDIITDILESIESGVAEERGMGTLNEAQVDDLLQKVWNLKTRT